MTMALNDELRGVGFRGEIVAERPLAPLTTWRIGGPAEWLATPADAEDLIRAVAFAHRRALPWRILGNGSNLLVGDAGVRGLVLRVRRVLDGIALDPPRLTAGAGASFPAVANAAAERGLAGIEFGAGIPGSVGGSIVMNAGWHAFEVGNIVHRVRYLECDGTIREFAHDACRFGYRTSAFRGRGGVVLEAELTLTPDEPARVRERLQGFAESRKANQPTELPSCGSVFLKPAGDFAGRLIEAAGLKGRRVGGIEVSTKHANFFVNTGGGTAKDVMSLVELVERTVFERFGVTLTREFEIW
jgi:UDP-N-acetylmuramate dehydrogenase